MERRFSKKRQAIVDCLKKSKEHPSAEAVHRALKDTHPELSLGTVYRNLTELKAEGVIRSVGTVDGKERFDGRTDAHSHVVCVRCGKVADVSGVALDEDVLKKLSAITGYAVDGANVRFYGLCEECKKAEQSDNKKKRG